MHSRNVPALRVEGFDGEWNAKPFSEMVERSTLMPAEPSLPRVEYEDIVSGAGVLNKNLRFKESIKTGIYFQPGDVLYGKLRPYLKNWLLATFEGIAVGDFWVLRPENTDSRYLYSLIQSNAFVAVASVSSGSKMPRADWRLVSGTAFNTPPTLEEQQAIGAIFTNLDAAINQHTKKHKSLQQAKTALMQRMFPQEGQTVPELRLDGFDGEWGVVTVNEITNSFSGGTPAVGTSAFYGGDIPFIRSSEISSSFTELTLTEAGLCSSSAKMVQPGWVLYALYGATAGEVSLAKIEGAINQAILALIPREGFSASYLVAWLRMNKKNIIDTYLQGGQGNLSGALVKNLEVMIPPTLEEQQAIGAVFIRLDTLISTEAKYIESFKQAKAALLQRMFV